MNDLHLKTHFKCVACYALFKNTSILDSSNFTCKNAFYCNTSGGVHRDYQQSKRDYAKSEYDLVKTDFIVNKITPTNGSYAANNTHASCKF